MPDRAILLACVTLLAFAIAGWRFAQVFRPVFRGGPAARFDQPRRRLKGVLGDIGLHRRLFRYRWSGILHAFMMSGFLVLLTVTLESFVRPFFPGFSLDAIGGSTGLALVQEIFAGFILIALSMAIWQRLVWKPKRFRTSSAKDAWIIYALVGTIVASLVLEAACHQILQGGVSPWRPVSGTLARILTALGMGQSGAAVVEPAAYWLHVAAILSFLVYIPGSKHRHIFTAAFNIYFRPLDRAQELPKTDPDAASVGVVTIEDFSWKHKLDLVSCTECGRCEAACPANAAGLPLSPKLIVTGLRDHMIAEEKAACEHTPIVGNVIPEETLFACTTCRACMDACPVWIEPMSKIIELRRTAVEEGSVEPMLQTALKNFQNSGNSQGKPARQRPRWAKGLDFAIKDAREEPVDILWFVGDHASYDPRVQEITRKVAKLLHEAGVDFGILHDGETNAGNDVRRIGEEGMFQDLAQANVEAINGCTFNRILTTDPHSLNALKNDYRQFGTDYTVVHYTELLVELVGSGALTLEVPEDGAAVTYHDPCYLGRYNGVFDAPRDLIRMAGYEVHEMARNRENSFCCGAGGGRIWMDDSAMTERPSESRIKEALSIGNVTAFVVACPKDLIMYSAAVQALGVGDRIRVTDIADLLIPRAA
ncbi:heterodisulfide reductase-related iron-sulfur binding cluster [Pseudogemmobacter humi]|uniref:Succinate dehydrogenase/fumarate reductase iron-sulfur subunit n=1 Tax=Pseudogemmobacter humi TaxID=2483812 RepID=A0A3P5X3E9_9RHOB|nr:heterodisulfide reductase-related iron-sulfur binding cluster [Pseudogemmobacter humi]VDC22687.1 succinate dehydrogenase/fumarate reductase iron-sulfur subunit [Pseudogemmobacter humi]